MVDDKKENKNIGIIGYWFASNYGGVASYYSLYKMIENMGYSPFLVDNPYFETDKEGEEVFSKIFFRKLKMNIAAPLNNNNLNKLNELTNTFLLGSDQVFTTNSIRAFGKLFLMEFAQEDKRRIAYSASCGGDNLNFDMQLLEYTKKYLKNFDYISVREYSAVDLLIQKLGIKAEQMIDPIFFTKVKDYQDLARQSKLIKEEDYLFAYILDPTEDKEKIIKEVSQKINLPYKIALDGRKYTHTKNYEKFNDKNNILPELDEFEWLFYLVNSTYIVTDSYHGAAMAIILNKPFIMIANAGRGLPRFLTLAKMFNLSKKLIVSYKDLDEKIINDKIEFKFINKKIKEETKKSVKWLKKAIDCKIKKKEDKKVEVINKNEFCESEIEKLNNDRDFVNIRLLATLLRDYGVKHIVLSPGGRDVPIVRMFEYNENSFILHRITDERSAAYYGLGIATQLMQPVVCICTSGTAASNYLPAVTEAFYTGIPLILVTADRYSIFLNQGEDQTIPQKNIYRDVVKMEISLPEATGWYGDYVARRDISACILETTHNGYGPVHINVPISNVGVGANVPKECWSLLPKIYPHILRASFINDQNEMLRWVKSLKESQRILIVYGQTSPINEEQKKNIEDFASKYNCVIVTDYIANLDCKYNLKPHNMLQSISQKEFNDELSPDILITVGGKRLMNDPLTYKIRNGKSNIRHWSVIANGNVKDFYFRLTSIIESEQNYFFKWFADNAGDIKNNEVYYNKWKNLTEKYEPPIISNFNSLYIYSKFLPIIPKNSILHLGVGQTFIECRRFHIDSSVNVYCNMGTNGIDGCTSTFMGQCSVVDDKLCFLIVGDLSFFYDMNSIWNKPLKKNIRILMINNNGSGLLKGNKLKAITSIHNTAAEGWVRSTGFEYMQAKTKEEFEEKLKYFISDKPQNALFFEVLCER